MNKRYTEVGKVVSREQITVMAMDNAKIYVSAWGKKSKVVSAKFVNNMMNTMNNDKIDSMIKKGQLLHVKKNGEILIPNVDISTKDASKAMKKSIQEVSKERKEKIEKEIASNGTRTLDADTVEKTLKEIMIPKKQNWLERTLNKIFR